MSTSGGAAPSQGDGTAAGQPAALPDSAAVLQEHLRAFNAGDLPALLDRFTSDADWMTGSTRARGRAELAELFGRAMVDLRPTLTLRTLLATPERVACELIEVLTVGGSRRTCAIAGFYEIAGSRIASARIYREGSADVS